GRIFEEFVQVDQTLARRKGGAGLGLAIASRLARLMGGDIAVSSVAGSGSRFTLTLPRASDVSEKRNVSRLSTRDETVDDIRAEGAGDGRRSRSYPGRRLRRLPREAGRAGRPTRHGGPLVGSAASRRARCRAGTAVGRRRGAEGGA